MNKDKIEEQLEQLNFPEIKLNSHQSQLKSILMQSDSFKLKNNIFSMKKAFKLAIPAAALAGLTLVIVFSLNPFTNKSQVQAKELIQQSTVSIKELSDDVKSQLEALIKDNLSNALEEAYRAKDLEYVGEEDFSKYLSGEDSQVSISRKGSVSVTDVDNNPITITTTTKEDEATITVSDDKKQNPADKIVTSVGQFTLDDSIDISRIKILKYTNDDGQKVTLGLSQDNFPVMKVITLNENK